MNGSKKSGSKINWKLFAFPFDHPSIISRKDTMHTTPTTSRKRISKIFEGNLANTRKQRTKYMIQMNGMSNLFLENRINRSASMVISYLFISSPTILANGLYSSLFVLLILRDQHDNSVAIPPQDDPLERGCFLLKIVLILFYF